MQYKISKYLKFMIDVICCSAIMNSMTWYAYSWLFIMTSNIGCVEPGNNFDAAFSGVMRLRHYMSIAYRWEINQFFSSREYLHTIMICWWHLLDNPTLPPSSFNKFKTLPLSTPPPPLAPNYISAEFWVRFWKNNIDNIYDDYYKALLLKP